MYSIETKREIYMSSQVAIVQIKGGNADPTSEALLPSSFSPTYFFVPANVIWAAAVSLYFFAAIAALLTTVVLGRVAIWPWPELSAIWAAKPGMRIAVVEEESVGRTFSLSSPFMLSHPPVTTDRYSWSCFFTMCGDGGARTCTRSPAYRKPLLEMESSSGWSVVRHFAGRSNGPTLFCSCEPVSTATNASQ